MIDELVVIAIVAMEEVFELSYVMFARETLAEFRHVAEDGDCLLDLKT